MTTPWKIEPVWQGQTVAVLASGPSMTSDVAEYLRQHKCIVTKRTHRIAPWADMLVISDVNLPLWAEAESFSGIKVCGIPTDDVDALFPGMMYERVTIAPGHVIEVRYSGLAAIRIAAAMGASKIILAGFDPDAAPGRYQGLKEGLAAIATELTAQGIEVEFFVLGDGNVEQPADDMPPMRPRRSRNRVSNV